MADGSVSTALVVLNPRDIPECMVALRALDLPTCWVSYMSEAAACGAINRAIARSSYDRYVLISDDTVPSREALDMVLAAHDQGFPVATGYCNLDSELPFVNLCWNRLPDPPPTAASYGLLTSSEVDAYEPGFPLTTSFTGLCLTTMSRDMWLRYRMEVTSFAAQSDYLLSWRLQRDEVPIVAPVGAFVRHVKERWNLPDENPEKRLLIGERPQSVTWTNVEVAA